LPLAVFGTTKARLALPFLNCSLRVMTLPPTEGSHLGLARHRQEPVDRRAEWTARHPTICSSCENLRRWWTCSISSQPR
jgi:hypothetical protein